MKCLAAGLLLTLAVFLSNAAQADPPTATFYPFNGAASVTLVSGTTLTLNRLGSVSSCNLTLGGTAGYTANLILSDSGIHAGDVYLVAVSYPAISSTSPVLNIYDSGTAGTLLISSTATLTAGSTTLEFVNVTGSSWVHFPKGAVLTKNLGAGVQSALQSGTFPAAAVSVTAFSLAGAINGTQVTGTVPASSTSGTAGAVSAVLSNYPLSNPLVSSSMTWTVMNTQQWTCPVNPNTMLETWDAANNQPLPYNVGTTVVNGEIETPPGAGQVFYGLGTHFLSPYFVFGETVRRMSGNGSGDQTEIELFDGINSYGFTYINNTKSIIGHIKNLSDYFYTPNGVQLTGTQNSAPGNFGYPIDLSSGNFQFAEAGGDGLLWAVVRTPRIPWTPVAVLDPSSFVDLKNPANLALMTPRYYNYNSGGTGAGMIAETNLFAGYTAGFNVCNLSELKYGDGSPLVKAGIHYELGNFVTLSSTAAKDVPSSSAAVFAWDERTHLLACTGVINTNRSGELYGENSGAWIFDPATNLFKCFIPNWGDGNSLGAPVQRIYEYDSAEPLLNGLHVLPNGTQLSLPMISSTSTESVYDPDVAIVSGTTFMAYTELVSGSSGFVTLVSGSSTRALGNVVWRQTSLPGTCEGNKIRQIGGVWKVLTTGTGQTTRVLNFNTGALEDTWNIGIQSSQGPCHPNITTVSGSGGSTEIYMLTFNGFSLPALWDARNITNLSTGAVGGSYQGNSEGQFVVLKCNQTEAGDEYPRIARTVPEAGAIDWKPYPFSSSALPPLGFTGVMTSGTFILGNPAIANNNVTAWDTTSPSPLKITTTGTTATISLSGTASDSVAGYIFP